MQLRIYPTYGVFMEHSVLFSTLQLAASRSLPNVIDNSTVIDLPAFKALLEAGLVAADNASADGGDCFLNPTITFAGLNLLSKLSPKRDIPWWKSFDRRIAVIGVVVALVSVIANMDMPQWL